MKLPFTYKIQDLLIRNNFEELEARRMANAGTTFPKNPFHGQRFTYIADAGPPKRLWEMEYHSDDGKWHWVGGDWLYAEVETDQQAATGTAIYIDLATVGPQLTAPFAGDYEYDYGFNAYQAGGTTSNPTGSVHVNAVSQGVVQVVTVGGGAGSAMRRDIITGVSASHVFKLMYLRNATLTHNFRFRWLAMHPNSLTIP